ncbi:MAG TPA: FAD-dependent oxidoreductase [Gemmatimonadales bacterium]|jgi:NADPH-dependent 2,4-dienoyl-CoA reductase/sulfur reductase-like enzyme
MTAYRYLIIGGGMTADAAVHGIRAVDAEGTIGLFGAEQDPPYNRPPLTKGLWKGDTLDSIWRKTGDVAVDLNIGRSITAVDLPAKHVTDSAGNRHTFDKLLFATGAKPRQLPFGGDDVIYYRSLDDYRRVRALATKGSSFVVIGGGFIGSEIAAGLAMNDCKVTMIFPEPGIGARIFPADLAVFLVTYYREKGVDVRAGEQLASIDRVDGQLTVTTKAGKKIKTDAVIAGIGVEPEVELARGAGLAVEDGIIVDEHLTTSLHDIYAAGDVARFQSPQLGKRMRVEHEDNANTMGTAAGRAMAGDATPYTHLPFFYSDLFDLGYEAVGETDPRLDVVADWKEKFREGVVYYLSLGRVRGVLLWNTWGQVDHARELIAEPGPFDAESLKGRLPK